MRKRLYDGELNRRVSRNIKRYRLAKDLTQKAVCMDVGISRSYLARIENNVSQPSLSVLVKIAEVLGVTCNDLLK